MTLTDFLQLAFIPIVYIVAYLTTKQHIPAWSEPDRGFQSLEHKWPKIFTWGGISATIVAVLLLVFTPLNVVTAIALAITSGFLLMGAYTDNLLYKVPVELSDLNIRVSFILGMGALLYNGLIISEGTQKFYDTPAVILFGEWYYWLLGGLLIGFVGFLIWMRISGLLGLLAILVSAAGLWVALYAGMSTLADWLYTTSIINVISPEGINSILVYGVPSALAVVLVASAFQLGSDGKMGGADPAAMYAVGWSFGPVIGGIVVGIGVVIAALVQLILHIVARPLKLGGRERTVPHDPIVYSFKKAVWKIKRKEGEPEKTYTALSLPFLPTLNIVSVATMLVFLSLA